MSKCDCCGNEIRVFDTYKDCVLNKKSFNVCNSCSNKIDKWTKGELKSSEFISTETDMGLANTLIEIEKSHQNGLQATKPSEGLGFIGSALGFTCFILFLIGIFTFFVGLWDGSTMSIIGGISVFISSLFMGGIFKIICLLIDIKNKL